METKQVLKPADLQLFESYSLEYVFLELPLILWSFVKGLDQRKFSHNFLALIFEWTYINVFQK